MRQVSCIIPAYNEGPRIGNVLKAACGHPLIGEIIVIDDGSKDNTREEAKKYGSVNLIVNEKNKGKSYSFARGVEQSKEDIILMLDADLVGLTPQNITDLIEPVFSGKADISLSLRKNSTRFYRAIKLDFVSGERVFNKKLIREHIEEIKKLPGYGLEIYLNKLIVKNKLRIKVVDWENLSITKKFHKKSDETGLLSKIGFLSRMMGEVSMTLEILKVASVFEIAYLLIKMSLLKVK